MLKFEGWNVYFAGVWSSSEGNYNPSVTTTFLIFWFLFFCEKILWKYYYLYTLLTLQVRLLTEFRVLVQIYNGWNICYPRALTSYKYYIVHNLRPVCFCFTWAKRMATQPARPKSKRHRERSKRGWFTTSLPWEKRMALNLRRRRPKHPRERSKMP